MGFAVAVNETGAIVCSASASGDAVVVVLHPLPGLSGDTNCDQAVSIDDLLTVIAHWGPGASYADLNGDQVVNVLDLLIVIDNWTF